MTESRVPEWHVAVGHRVRPEEVYGVFRALLDNLPMSRTELARLLKVTQPAVSRWASGDARPSLQQMRAAIDAITARTMAIQNSLWRAGQVVSLVEDAVETQTQTGRNDDRRSLEERDRITSHLAELLGES
jgi:transcriptional regulator with XRE-family HTH domain